MYHPDKVKPEEVEQVKEKFQVISEAYSVLSDDDLRAQYDAKILESNGQSVQMSDDFMEKVYAKQRTPYTSFFENNQELDPFFAKWTQKERIPASEFQER